jgi:hypothetical protein
MVDWHDIYQPRIFLRAVAVFFLHAIAAVVLFLVLAFVFRDERAGFPGFLLVAINWLRMNVQILRGRRNWITRPLYDDLGRRKNTER